MTIFEKIVNREIGANIIYEDNDIMAFLDIAPISVGHTLVIPKKPYKDIYEMPDDIIAKLFKVVKDLSIKLKKVFKADGINLINNNEKKAGQVVFHYHVHIIPRYNDDLINLHADRLNATDSDIKSWYEKITNTK